MVATKLAGTVAVVTGGASGMGRGCAIEFAKRGADIVVADLHDERMAAVVAEVEALGRRAIGVHCDVASDDSVRALHDRVIEHFGRADVVMANAGVLAVGLPQDIPIDEWRRVFEVNLMGVVRVVLAFLPGLVERQHGHVVTTASTAGLLPYAFDRLPYAASKGGVVSFTESLALYLIPLGIGVTSLCPGPVATNIAEQVVMFGPPRPIRAPQLSMNTPDVVGQWVADAVEQGRFQVLTSPDARPDLVAKATDPDAYLAKQLAWITST